MALCQQSQRRLLGMLLALEIYFGSCYNGVDNFSDMSTLSKFSKKMNFFANIP